MVSEPYRALQYLKFWEEADLQWQEFESQRSGTSQGLRASLSIKPELSPWGSVMKEGGPISSSQSDDDGEPRLPLGGLRKKEQGARAWN